MQVYCQLMEDGPTRPMVAFHFEPAANRDGGLVVTSPRFSDGSRESKAKVSLDTRDARIVKICQIAEYRIVPNSWDQLFSNTNTNS